MPTASAKKMAPTKNLKTPKPTSRKGLKCPDAPLRIRGAVYAIVAANRLRRGNLANEFQAVASP